MEFTKEEIDLMMKIITSTPLQGSLKSGLTDTVKMMVEIMEKLGKMRESIEQQSSHKE